MNRLSDPAKPARVLDAEQHAEALGAATVPTVTVFCSFCGTITTAMPQADATAHGELLFEGGWRIHPTEGKPLCPVCADDLRQRGVAVETQP